MATFKYPDPGPVLLTQDGDVYQPVQPASEEIVAHAQTVASMLLACLGAAAATDPLGMSSKVDELLTHHYAQQAQSLATGWAWHAKLSRLRELEQEHESSWPPG